jgi:O-antigen/teichoic acid export membrane protein
MGIVQKQTLRGTVWSYLGAILGFVNMALLSPKIFTSGEIGVLQVLVSFATIMAQFSSLGFTNVINRLFPYFRDIKEKHNGFLALALSITLIGFILALVFLKFYTPHFVENNIDRSPLISNYAFYLPSLLLITLLFNLFDNYNKVLYDAVLGTFLREFLFRFLNLGLIVLFWLHLINYDDFVFGYVICLSVPLFIIFIKLVQRGEIHLKLKLSFLTPELKKEILFLSFFGALTGFSAFVLTTLDKLFINKYLGESQVGIYTIASYFAVLIMLPSKSISKIAVPFLAESWKKDDLKTIEDIYVRSSINQFAIGLLIFIGIIVNLGNVFRILPAEYTASTGVIIFLSLGNLVNVSSGISGTIIGTSTLYRYQTWLMFILIVSFIISSIIFIPLFGISGAAFAGMLSNIIFNTLGVIIIGRKYKLWPYNLLHLKMILVALVVMAAGYFIPQMSKYIDIIVRSGIVTILFVAGLYFWKLSGDMNRIIDSAFISIKKYIS